MPDVEVRAYEWGLLAEVGQDQRNMYEWGLMVEGRELTVVEHVPTSSQPRNGRIPALQAATRFRL